MQSVRLRAVSYRDVRIQDSFWAARREVNRKATLPHILAMLEKEGHLDNLRLAAERKTEGYRGPVFADSDVYKALEAISYVLAENPTSPLKAKADTIIELLVAAQEDNGYINSYYQTSEPERRRFSNLRDNHELYCIGHLIEAGVAHHEATGEETLLELARRAADHVYEVFMDREGGHPGYPGHPEIELALIRLSRVLGDSRYTVLAAEFINRRGSGYFNEEHGKTREQSPGRYWQDECPIRERESLEGHAVRGLYLMSGAADLTTETGERDMAVMLHRVWQNLVRKRLYITGGAGNSAENEGFTRDYDLPNATAYQETCASIAVAMWSHRMALLLGDSRYVDTMEAALYNAVLAGLSADGKRFFYANPLESDGSVERQHWFGCACCPPNVARVLASIGNYAYATSGHGLWVNMYIKGGVTLRIDDSELNLYIQTEYPWDESVRIIAKVDNPVRMVLHLRIPEWCHNPVARVSGQTVMTQPGKKGYLEIDREWHTGDWLELDLPMPIQKMQAQPAVADNRGKVALRRGPIVYCFEQADHSVPLNEIFLPPDAEFRMEQRSSIMGNHVALTATALHQGDAAYGDKLYSEMTGYHETAAIATPYYAWGNRQPGPMKVWMPIGPPLR